MRAKSREGFGCLAGKTVLEPRVRRLLCLKPGQSEGRGTDPCCEHSSPPQKPEFAGGKCKNRAKPLAEETRAGPRREAPGFVTSVPERVSGSAAPLPRQFTVFLYPVPGRKTPPLSPHGLGTPRFTDGPDAPPHMLHFIRYIRVHASHHAGFVPPHAGECHTHRLVR